MKTCRYRLADNTACGREATRTFKLDKDIPLCEEHFQEYLNFAADQSVKFESTLLAEWTTHLASFIEQWTKDKNLTIQHLNAALALAAEYSVAEKEERSRWIKQKSAKPVGEPESKKKESND